jgi:hypothetical protein
MPSATEGPAFLIEFLGVDIAIAVAVPPGEPPFHGLVQLFIGDLLIAVGVNKIEECGGTKANEKRTATAKLIGGELAVAIHVGGAQEATQFAGNLLAAGGAVTVGVENFQLTTGMTAPMTTAARATFTTDAGPFASGARLSRATLGQGGCGKTDR